jgi:hypothetical protein
MFHHDHRLFRRKRSESLAKGRSAPAGSNTVNARMGQVASSSTRQLVEQELLKSDQLALDAIKFLGQNGFLG